MKFRAFLNQCLAGDSAALGKIGGLSKKKPADDADNSKIPAADLSGTEDKPVEKLPTANKTDDVSIAKKPPKENADDLNGEEENEDDIIMVKAKKKKENDEGMKESFLFLNSLQMIKTAISEDATNFNQVHPPHEMMDAIDEIDKISKENFARYASGGNKMRDITKVFTDLWNKEVVKGGETPADVNWEDVCDTLEMNFFNKFKNNQGENKQQWESDPVFEKWMEEVRDAVEKFHQSMQ